VLLPPDKDNAVLSRQLLYTALTRAKAKIELWSTQEVLEAALARPVERSAALCRRIAAHKKSPC
jgi:exodeoxyribonuclease V alpha subunit